MEFKFDSVEQEKKDITLASAKSQAWAQNMVCSNCGTLRSKDVHYKFSWVKLGAKQYKATITEQSKTYTLYASTRKGLKYLFAEFIEYMYTQIVGSKDVERTEYSHDVTPTDIQEATTTDVQEKIEFTDVIYLSAYDIKLYLHAKDYKVVSYRVERNKVHLGYIFYNLPTGTIRSIRGVKSSETKYIPLNIINVLRNRAHASTDIQDIEDISFTLRVIPCTIRNTFRLYIAVTGDNDVQEFLLAETDKQNNDTFICDVGTCLDIVKKINNFYSEQMHYNDILEKLWFEVCEFIKGTRAHLDNYKKGTNYYLALYSSNQRVTSLLEFRRIDVLFIRYFVDNNNVDIVALFPDIVTPNGYIQSYSIVGQHSEAHTDLLHCEHLELSEYKEVLMELLVLGYNLRVLNRN